MIDNNIIAGVMVTFNPDVKTLHNISVICNQVVELVIVDNGSQSSVLAQIKALSDIANVTLIELGDNFGIATALNRGCVYLLQKGYEWCVSFDQDSTPAHDMVSQLYNSYCGFSVERKVAVVGSNIIDVNNKKSRQKYLKLGRFGFFCRPNAACDRDDIAMVITSGSLTNIVILKQLGMFRDDYFIDYVDTEYCLRLIANGYRVAVSHKAILYHTLGVKSSHKIFGVEVVPTNHSFLRRYYIARNSIDMIRLYACKFPAWLFFDIVASCYNFFRVALFERDRYKKAIFSLRGFRDGIIKKSGRYE